MKRNAASMPAALALAVLMLVIHAGAADYGEMYDFELRQDEEKCIEILKEMIPGYNDDSIEADLAIVKAARSVADHLAGGAASRAARPDSEMIRRKLREAGVADQRVFFNYTQYLPGSDLRTYLQNTVKAGAERVPYTHVGVGVSRPGSAGSWLVVMLVERMVEIEPYPARVQSGSNEVLRARLVGPAKGLDAKVLLTSPAGKVMRVAVIKRGDELYAQIPFTYGEGVYWLEITVSGRNQAAAAAIMEVKATGSEKRASQEEGVFKIDFIEKDYSNPAEAEADVIKMVNQVRLRSGLEPFRQHPKLADMAGEHAKDMMENGYVGHFSPDWGSVARRAARAGIESADVMENVVVNTSVKAGIEELLSSPAHRKHIVNAELNRIGVGVAIARKGGQNWYYIAQEFAYIP